MFTYDAVGSISRRATVGFKACRHLHGAAAEDENKEEPKKPAEEMTEAEREAALKRARELNKEIATLYGQGKHRKAVPLAREALNIREKALGPDHPRTATTLHNLASLLNALGAYDEAKPLYERAFEAYKRVYEQFPDSGRVGDSVAKMANFYYQRKDYARAIDVFENVLDEHPDANFLDVILFNYGRCLYRLDRKPEARKKFDILISDFPESPLASEAKKITEALSKAAKPAP